VSSQPDERKERPAKRGEAAWKEVRERIAASNDQARRDARERRAAGEEMRVAARKTLDKQRRKPSVSRRRPSV
jgi:hypothetical protein